MQLQLAPSLPCERVRAVRLALAHPQLLLHLGHSGQQAALAPAPWRGAWLRLGPELVSLLWLRVPLKHGLAAASGQAGELRRVDLGHDNRGQSVAQFHSNNACT